MGWDQRKASCESFAKRKAREGKCREPEDREGPWKSP